MQTFTFHEGLEFSWNSTRMRMERLGAGGQIVLMRLEDGQLQVVTQAHLLQDYAVGKLVVGMSVDIPIAPTATWQRPLGDLPPNILSELKRRKHYLDFVEAQGDFTFTRACLGPALSEAANAIGDATPPSVTTFYRWHRTYQATHDIRALVPRYDRRGSRALKQTNRVLELAAEAIEEAYKATPRASMVTIETRLGAKLQAENRTRLLEDHLVAPSRRTLYRLFDRLEAYDKVVLQEGRKTADRRLRISKRPPQVSDILERVEVDHTPLDLFLIDDQTWLPLGRPTLTIAIDYYSRIVLGYYLSYGGTSTAAVMGLLRHAILPKSPSAQSISGLAVDHVWPCHGTMDTLVLDNGMEFHSQDLESVAQDLGVHLQFCPTRTPRFKGAVERFLKTANYTFAHQMPGTSLARFTQRGEYDPIKHALLTLSEFRHAFEKWMLDIYAQQIHRGIGTTPWAKWHEGLQRRPLRLANSRDLLLKRIGSVVERRLRHDGIWLHNIRYASDVLLGPLHQYGEGVQARIVYDQEDLGTIQVWLPDREDPITVPAVHAEYAAHLTLIQHRLLQKELQEMGKKTEDAKALFEAKVALATSLQDMVAGRKLTQRRRAARVHGMNSQQPDKRFEPGTKAVYEAQLPRLPGPENDTPPGRRYAFYQPAEGGSGEEAR